MEITKNNGAYLRTLQNRNIIFYIVKLKSKRLKINIMEKETCDRCGHDMEKMTTCHLICPNCGANYDCSDKGSVW